MLPWVGMTAIGASLLTAAAVKVVDYFKTNKQQNQKEIKEIEVAKQEIIAGIKAYDAEHENESSEDNTSISSI